MKKYLKCPLISFALAALLAFAPFEMQAQTSKEKIRLLSSGLRAHDAGDLEAARRNLEELLKIAPNDPNVTAFLSAVNKDLASQGKDPIRVPFRSSSWRH